MNFSGIILYWVNLPDFLQNIRLISISLFRLNFTYGDVNGNCPGYIFTGIELSRYSFHGGEAGIPGIIQKTIRN